MDRLRAKQDATQSRQHRPYGTTGRYPRRALPATCVDFAQIRARLHRLREDIYRDADSPDRMAALGVEVCQGHATLQGPRTVEIGGAARAVCVAAFW